MFSRLLWFAPFSAFAVFYAREAVELASRLQDALV